MVCRINQELLTEYLVAAEDFFQAVGKLSLPLTHSQFRAAMDKVEQTKLRCVRAREAMQEHRREHRCR